MITIIVGFSYVGLKFYSYFHKAYFHNDGNNPETNEDINDGNTLEINEDINDSNNLEINEDINSGNNPEINEDINGSNNPNTNYIGKSMNINPFLLILST